MGVKSSHESQRRAAAGRAAHGQRRGDLLAAGRTCFAELGVEGTTVEAILDRCGASIGSLYHHFEGKDGLAAALYLEGMDFFFSMARARLNAAETTADGAKALVRAYFDSAEADPAMVAFLMQARPYLARTRHAANIERKNEEFMPQIGAWFRERIRNREVRSLPPDCIIALIEGPARHYVRRWLATRTPLPLAEAREIFAQAAWDALRNDSVGPERDNK